MSHHSIWLDMLKKNHSEVIVFEDDLNIQPNFRERLKEVKDELASMKWDFIFIGRQISKLVIVLFPNSVETEFIHYPHLGNPNEAKVKDSKWLVHPKFSYWTLGYMLSESGAKKLIQEKPLGTHHCQILISEMIENCIRISSQFQEK